MLTQRATRRVMQMLYGGERWLSLHSGKPGQSGANELRGGSYERRPLPLALRESAGEGRAEFEGTIEIPDMPAATITHVGIWDAEGPVEFVALLAPVRVHAGNTYRIKPGDIDVGLRSEE